MKIEIAETRSQNMKPESGPGEETAEFKEGTGLEISIDSLESEGLVFTPLGPHVPDFSVRFRDAAYPLFVRDFTRPPYAQFCQGQCAWYFHGEGKMPPQIWMNESVPKKYWKAVLIHECAEAEGRRQEGKSDLQRHRQAMKTETEFARKHFTDLDFKEYLRWKKVQFREAFREKIKNKKGHA